MTDESIRDARARLDDASRIVSFSGAGLSVESGVSTFRDADDGFWSTHDPMRLASPDGFRADPDLVLSWYAYRREQVAGATPNAAHVALARRADITHVTQNVDDLLERAGATEVLHLHGHLNHDRCHASCGFVRTFDIATPPDPSMCPACGAPLRPGVVWFGEALPDETWTAAHHAVSSCDVLLVVGTSAAVYPAAGLIQLAHETGSDIIMVNPQMNDATALATHDLRGPACAILPALLSRDAS